MIDWWMCDWLVGVANVWFFGGSVIVGRVIGGCVIRGCVIG